MSDTLSDNLRIYRISHVFSSEREIEQLIKSQLQPLSHQFVVQMRQWFMLIQRLNDAVKVSSGFKFKI